MTAYATRVLFNQADRTPLIPQHHDHQTNER
jgi:hypothetical protein